MSNKQKPGNPALASVPDVTETFEQPLSEGQQAELDSLVGDPPKYHTILEIWTEILKSAQAEADSQLPVAPGWASRITAAYPQVKFADMVEFRNRYFGKIVELKDILATEVASDPDCLTYSEPAEDAKENATHYKNLLLLWQQQIVQWELNWDCTDPMAAVELGAISEVHRLFFNQTGLTSHLDVINFEFTEDDQLQLQQALSEMREAR